MKVIVMGGAGFIGQALIKQLLARGDEVIVLSQHPKRAAQVLDTRVKIVSWEVPQEREWVEAFHGVDAVVNLAGEPIGDKRWTEDQKKRIMDSRIHSTNMAISGMRYAKPRPRVLVNASAIGYYGSRGDTILDEDKGPGSDFLALVCIEWERTAKVVESLDARLVLLRSATVLGITGGALPRLALPFKLFVGGVLGPPNQWVSWIHIDDEVGLILFALDNEAVRGPLNATAPNPVTMDEFSHALGEALHRPVWVPGIPILLRLMLGERAKVLLSSQRAIPKRALELGYQFKYTDIHEALGSLLS
jgi:uncharacterized protein (TIGR01777 family)